MASELGPNPSEPSLLLALIQGGTALPKSIAKLIDTVGDQIGLFLEPMHTRRKGQAEADVQVAEARAKAEIAQLKIRNKVAIQSFEDRAEATVQRRKARQQINIESITAKAIKELPEDVSDKPIDEDWLSQLFDDCKNVSSDQMQTVWARLLAGEVANPGTFSLRTLAFVRTMNQRDAEAFTRFCSTLWSSHSNSDKPFPLTLNHSELENISGISLAFSVLLGLDSIGLIKFQPGNGFNMYMKLIDPPVSLESGQSVRTNTTSLNYFGKEYVFERKVPAHLDPIPFPIGVALLTDMGRELSVISGAQANDEYLSFILREMEKIGWICLSGS